MKNKKMNIEEQLETRKIKDANGENGFSLGIYNDKTAINGYYLKAKKGSLLERIENLFVTKFQLENDPENFRQEARLEMWLSINKYYDRFGYDENVKIDGFIYTNCKYSAMDKAKLAKSNVSTCDRSTGKYHINKIESYERKFVEEIDKVKNQKDERIISELYNKDFTEDEPMNEFRRWLEENKEYILTKKQIDYLEGNIIINDVSGQWRIQKNIASRIEKAYAQDKLRTDKLKKINKELKEIRRVLDFKDEEDFIKRVTELNVKNKMKLLLKIYENLQIDNCKILTALLEDKEIEISKEFYYDIISILTYIEMDLKLKIEELEGDE